MYELHSKLPVMVFDNEISTQIVSLFIILCMAWCLSSRIHSLRDAAQYRLWIYDDAHTHTQCGSLASIKNLLIK